MPRALPRLLAVSAAGLAAATLLAACGSGSGSASASSAPASDAAPSGDGVCSLLDADRLTTVLGSDPGPGVEEANSCDFATGALAFAVYADASNYDSIVAEITSDPTVESSEPVDGLGQQATRVTGVDETGRPQVGVIVQGTNAVVAATSIILDADALDSVATDILTAVD